MMQIRCKNYLTLWDKFINFLKTLITRETHIVVIHHTATDRDTTRFETIDENHKKRGFPESNLGYNCAYNYLIEGDGTTTQARSLDKIGWGVENLDKFHTDICLTGNFMEEELRKEQLDQLKELLGKINAHFPNAKILIKGHRDFDATLCPGDNLYEEISTWICS